MWLLLGWAALVHSELFLLYEWKLHSEYEEANVPEGW